MKVCCCCCTAICFRYTSARQSTLPQSTSACCNRFLQCICSNTAWFKVMWCIRMMMVNWCSVLLCKCKHLISSICVGERGVCVCVHKNFINKLKMITKILNFYVDWAKYRMHFMWSFSTKDENGGAVVSSGGHRLIKEQHVHCHDGDDGAEEHLLIKVKHCFIVDLFQNNFLIFNSNESFDFLNCLLAVCFYIQEQEKKDIVAKFCKVYQR